MKQFTAGKNEDGKRMDALITKLLPGAGKGFIYKMLRKKNIVVNEKKADGNTRINSGDVIKIYLSDETAAGFGWTDDGASGYKAGNIGENSLSPAPADSVGKKRGNFDAEEDSCDKESGKSGKRDAFGNREKGCDEEGKSGRFRNRDVFSNREKESDEKTGDFKSRIIYEDEDIMLMDKPAGILSQKAEADDISINEMMIGYLLKEGKLSERELRTYRPSVCNRLDRNTSGIICAGVSLKGLRELTALIRERKVEKYYMCIVKGGISADESRRETENGWIRLKSYFSKDEKTNTARISDKAFSGSVPVEIGYRAIKQGYGYTLLEVNLLTGKSHQIRAQLAWAGHPLAGDVKYGNKADNDDLRRKYGVRRQLLTAYRFVFPEDTVLEKAAGRTFTISLPSDFFLRTDQEK